ncbi:hypothetical protein LIER_36887 [Lithospermum erythrorhizon]|uniref:Uncharacterized protein n=1 Tax=Lithospermum erythrorhizon TaxID=34254 RepID=A0AAV3PCU4_LITER
MRPANSYKDVKKLTGCLSALNRFISKSGERNFPFFKNLRRMSKERSIIQTCPTYYSKLPEGVYIEVSDQPVYREGVIKSVADPTYTDWRTPITEYLSNGKLPSDNFEAKKV